MSVFTKTTPSGRILKPKDVVKTSAERGLQNKYFDTLNKLNTLKGSGKSRPNKTVVRVKVQQIDIAEENRDGRKKELMESLQGDSAQGLSSTINVNSQERGVIESHEEADDFLQARYGVSN